MRGFDLDEREAAEQAARWWWMFLVTGILWLLVAVIVLQFDYESVSAVSILFGVVAIFFGINEFIAMGASRGWWKVLRVVLGVLMIGAGIVALAKPGGTFEALAGVFAFFVLFKGIFDIVVALATKDEIHAWWLQLVAGIVEVGLSFWAAGYYGRSAVLLVAWVGVVVLIRGITEILLAFKLRGLKRAALA